MSGSKEAMEYIWERVPKQKDGLTIRYLKADLDYLYYNGFVDTRQFSIELWKKAFKNFEQEDGSFVLNKNQFMALRLFRYDGRSDEVFDPYKVQKGPWPDKSLQKLYDKSIYKASAISEETYWTFINEMKKKPGYLDANGHFIIDDHIIHELAVLLQNYPSPRRRLEIEVSRLREEKNKKLAGNAKNRDASGFTVGQSDREHKLDAYQKLKSSAHSVKQDPLIDPKKETIDIKQMRKPTPKFRG